MRAWIITKDHLFETDTETSDCAGTVGPAGVTDDQEALLSPGKKLPEGIERRAFRMYDDDGVLCFSGRAIYNKPDEGSEPDEDALVGPLMDFGRAYAGACRIKWHGRPEWESIYIY